MTTPRATIRTDGQIFIGNSNVGYHDNGTLYKFGNDGYAYIVGNFDNRAELHALVSYHMEGNKQ